RPSPSHFHLLFSLLLTFVAAIPNHTFRYTALGLLFVLAALCTVHLRSPSTQLRHLTHLIDQTEDLIQRAMVQCARDHSSLTEEMGQLLEANKTASLIKCRNLDSNGEQFNWNKYRHLCKDIAACAKRVRKIRTAVLVSILNSREQIDSNETSTLSSALWRLDTNVNWRAISRKYSSSSPPCLTPSPTNYAVTSSS
ncbi:hypothetical protein B0H13DRAFT_2076600, partial [Mycena leptocephala]